jgi:hypothetical protein
MEKDAGRLAICLLGGAAGADAVGAISVTRPAGAGLTALSPAPRAAPL